MSTVIELNVRNDGLLLTQYESTGHLGINEFKKLIFDEYLNFEESDIDAYNEYLYETEDEPCPLQKDLDVLLEGMTPTQIARACFYGDFRFAADYHCINGEGNIDSLETYEAEKLMNDDTDFKEWYFKHYVEYDDEDLIEEVIKEGNRLLKLGY